MVPQLVVIDDRRGWNMPSPDPVRYAESLHSRTAYVLVNDSDGYADAPRSLSRQPTLRAATSGQRTARPTGRD